MAFASELLGPVTRIADSEGLVTFYAWQGATYMLTVRSPAQPETPLVRREISASTDVITLVVP